MKVGVYMAKLNLKEFYQLGYTGEIDHKKQLAAMAKMVEDGFADILILTLGDQGALLADRNGKLLHIAPPSTKVVSHVGAGDSFVSLMLYQLCSGKTVEEAFRFGVAAAAAAIQTTGNQIQDMHSIEKIYRELGGN
ncbi:MAG: 6-phosphofructokinase 2 [Gammaproteobacteria bacterium]